MMATAGDTTNPCNHSNNIRDLARDWFTAIEKKGWRKKEEQMWVCLWTCINEALKWWGRGRGESKDRREWDKHWKSVFKWLKETCEKHVKRRNHGEKQTLSQRSMLMLIKAREELRLKEWETEYYSKCEARFSNRHYYKQKETTLWGNVSNQVNACQNVWGPLWRMSTESIRNSQGAQSIHLPQGSLQSFSVTSPPFLKPDCVLIHFPSFTTANHLLP